MALAGMGWLFLVAIVRAVYFYQFYFYAVVSFEKDEPFDHAVDDAHGASWVVGEFLVVQEAECGQLFCRLNILHQFHGTNISVHQFLAFADLFVFAA